MALCVSTLPLCSRQQKRLYYQLQHASKRRQQPQNEKAIKQQLNMQYAYIHKCIACIAPTAVVITIARYLCARKVHWGNSNRNCRLLCWSLSISAVK